MSIEAREIVAGYYEEVDILHNVSIYAGEPKITSIIGPNGSGKSTFLKVIYGFLKLKQGKILYNGEDVTDLKPMTD